MQSVASLSAGNSSEDASGGQYPKLRSLPGRTPRASAVTKSSVAKLASASSTDFKRHRKAQSHQKALAELSLAGSIKQAEPVKHEASSEPPESAAEVTAASTASGSSPNLAASVTVDASMTVSATQAAAPQSTSNPPAQSEAILVPELSKSALVTVNGSPVEVASTVNVSQIPRAASPGFPEEASMPEAARVFSGGHPALTQATEASCSFSVSFPVTALAPPAATLHTSLPASNTAAKATSAMSTPMNSAASVTPAQSVMVSMAPHIPSTAPETAAAQLLMFLPRSAVVSQQVMKSTVIAAGPGTANDESRKGHLPATTVIKSEYEQLPNRSMEQLAGVPHYLRLGTPKGMVVSGRLIASCSPALAYAHANTPGPAPAPGAWQQPVSLQQEEAEAPQGSDKHVSKVGAPSSQHAGHQQHVRLLGTWTLPGLNALHRHYAFVNPLHCLELTVQSDDPLWLGLGKAAHVNAHLACCMQNVAGLSLDSSTLFCYRISTLQCPEWCMPNSCSLCCSDLRPRLLQQQSTCQLACQRQLRQRPHLQGGSPL